MDTREYPSSWRLTFRFDGERVELVRRERLPMIAPGSPGTPPVAGEQGGSWVEIQDERQSPVFHRLLHDPFRTSAEVHSPDGRIELHTGPPQPGEFDVVVPDAPEATSVALFTGELGPPGGGRRLDPPRRVAREVFRFPLREEAAP